MPLLLALLLLAPPLNPADLPAHAPRFAPDGTEIVFYSGPEGAADIYRVGLDGRGLARLTHHPGDDRDPTWGRDGHHIVWSSNRAGTYDLWSLELIEGALPVRLTDLPGDELEPTASSLRYHFYAVFQDECAASGAGATELDTYDKVVFTRRDGEGGEGSIWFTATSGGHLGRLSPEGSTCRSPRYSRDGLSLVWACRAPGGWQIRQGDARWDQGFPAALKALEAPSVSCDAEGAVGPKTWRGDACLQTLPRRYTRHPGRPVSAPALGLGRPGFSANQIVLLATGSGQVVTRPRQPPAGGAGDLAWQPLILESALGGEIVAADWSPTGTQLVVEEAGGAIRLAPTDFYLQAVGNLIDFPELFGRGRSARLHRNHFVARPGREKELFQLYDKHRYSRRGSFVTVDAALQILHDELASIMKKAEVEAQQALGALSAALMAHWAAACEASKAPSACYLATLFAVPAVILQAAAAVEPPEPPEWGAPEHPPNAPPAEQMAGALSEPLEALPAGVDRARVRAHLEAILAHRGFAELPVPGVKRPAKIDYSLFQVRGHYNTSSLAGYFLTMTWYGLAPMPLDGTAFETARLMAPDRPAGRQWHQIDALVGTLMGRPVDVSPAHLRQVAREHPDWIAPRLARAKVLAELRRLRGELPLRGAAAALGQGGDPPLQLTLFPKRFGLDTGFFKQLTHPDVPERGWPRALDALAALGAPRARAHALAAERGERWAAAYQAQLDKLALETRGRPESDWSSDVYHSWLALLRALATPRELPAGTPLIFARSDAWHDRELFSALAGYAMLKHDSVLYAVQDYSAECGGGITFKVLVEQPMRPPPRGFVEPRPKVFHRAADLAGLIYQRLAGGQAPRLKNAQRFATKLAELAEKEVAGQPLSPADLAWLRGVGALMEDIFLGSQKPEQPGPGIDEGRADRGVTLVADVHTNVTSQEVLEQGIGWIMDLYVAVPNRPAGLRMVHGGVHSYFELRWPMSDRLTDERWLELLRANDPRLHPPTWTQSFIEPAAGAD